MSRSCRQSIALALVIAAGLVVLLPRTALAATPRPTSGASAALGTTAASGATTGSGATGAPDATTLSGAVRAPGASSPSGLCALSGLLRTDGSRCPGTGRLRRQILGIPNPLHDLPNPVHVINKVAGGVATTAFKAVGLGMLVGWVASGAESALKDTAKVIGSSTKPQLTSSWFSASYWKVAAIAMLLTLPFLCAAAIHALVRSDLGLLTRAAFGYLPLSLLAVAIASQLTMLLLSATDEMSSIIASASGNADGAFLARAGVEAIAASIGEGSPFVAFLAAIITVAAALTLWVELLVRDAAVYVIVLMLPLFFAAMVWPARRTLATRAIETLIALILSKFAIVAVLSLGGAALGHSSIPGPAAVLTGATLVLLAAFSPWALLRMLPLHEVASAAAGGLSQGLRQGAMTNARTAVGFADGAVALGAEGAEWLRPRMASGARSLLDGGRYRDAHRSAMGSESEPSTDPLKPADPGGDLEPVAAGIAGGPLGGGATSGVDDAAADDWAWPRSSGAANASSGPADAGTADEGAATGGAGGEAATGAAGGGAATDAAAGGTATGAAGGVAASGGGPGGRNAGGPPPDTVGPAAHGADRGGAQRGPDGERFPYVLGPDDPPLVFSDELRALADRAAAYAGPDHMPEAAADPLEAPPQATGVDPPPLAGQDPVGPPPPPPGHDPTGLSGPVPSVEDPEPPVDGR